METNIYFERIGYSDIEPYEAINKISEKTIEIRKMDYNLIKHEELKSISGGFLSHCFNQNEPMWEITSNENNKVFRIRFHKDGSWRDKDGNRYRIMDII